MKARLLSTTLLIFCFTWRIFSQEGTTIPMDSVGSDTSLAFRFAAEALDLLQEYRLEEASKKLSQAEVIFREVLGDSCREMIPVLLRKGLVYYYQGDLEGAIEVWEACLPIAYLHDGMPNLETAKILNNLGSAYSDWGKLEAALKNHQKALKIRTEILGKNHPEVASSLNNIANVFTYQGQYDQALALFQESLSIRLETLGAKHPLVASSYANLGNVYHFKGDYRTAREYQEKALQIRAALLGREHPDLANTYTAIGNCHFDMGQYEGAIDNYWKALSIRLRVQGDNHPDVGSLYLNIGAAYAELESFEKGISYTERALEVFRAIYPDNHIEIANSYNNLGNYCRALHLAEKAENYFEKSIVMKKALLGNQHESLASSYNNLGMVYLESHDLGNARLMFDSCLAAFPDLKGTEHPELSVYFSAMAMVEWREGRFAQAQIYFQKALQQLRFLENSDNWRLEINSPVHFLKVAEKLGRFYLDRFCQVKELGFLYSAREILEKGLELIYQNHSQSSLSIIWSNPSLVREIYEVALRVNQKFYENLADSSALQKGFELMERSKSLQLHYALQESEALAFAGIPDSLLIQEQNLRVDITYWKQQRQEALMAGKSEADTTVLAMQDKIFESVRRHEILKMLFENDFPTYYRLKYDLNNISLSFLQDSLLQPQQTLLSYFVGDSSIFIMAVCKDTSQMLEIAKDFPLDQWIREWQKSIAGFYSMPRANQTDLAYERSLAQYRELALLLYQKLLKPVAGFLTSNLVIIPDGMLGNLPFEALLSGAPEDFYNLRAFPYLVKEHEIAYCYSATLLHEMKSHKQVVEATREFISFAPFYEGNYQMLEEKYSNIDFYGKNVSEKPGGVPELSGRNKPTGLPASGEEAYVLSKLFNGVCFLNREATKEIFLKNAGNYRIIHLSTHGVADSLRGESSFLAFSPTRDSGDSGKLRVREIYNMQLPVDLVVLSACETGIGQLMKGEGIISLARAFAFAGARSMVTTLWTIEDVASRDLMVDFYTGLQNRESKERALALAKRKMVAQGGERAHPFFWAGFVAIGDMRGLK